MSKKLINKLSFFILCFILSFHSISQSSETLDYSKIQNWIEGIPILPSLLKNKRDVVEFDSSNGKIISISFDVKSLSKNKIFLFYKNFFKEKNWKEIEDKNAWIIRNERFKKKVFKIEGIENKILKIKIIIENF
tara:strand:+ start:24 stop:425 length:402 start_codon:yes stop_codon:yes gene_type:complete